MVGEQEVKAALLNPYVIIFCSILIPIFFYKRWTAQGSSKILPPSPAKLPVIGNLHQLSSLPHRSLASLAQKHGPLILIHLGRVPTLVASSADAAQEIMKTHDLIFSNRPRDSKAKRLLYDSKDISAASYGEYWRQMKSIVVLQLLSNRRVQSFRFVREEETAKMVEKIQESCSSSSPVNLSQMFVSFTSDVICRSAFGRKYSEGEDGNKFLPLIKEFLVLLATISVGDFIPWLKWIDRVNGFDAKVDSVSKELDEFIEEVIQKREKSMGKVSSETAQVEGVEDFLDILLKVYNDDTVGIPIDRDSIKAVILDIFAAGADTTATVLEWAMSELLKNPKTMKKLQQEVRQILGDKTQITDEDLGKMQYLNAVLKETLRLHPPVPTLAPRVAGRDVRMMGYDIDAGTMVMINAWAIGRDPKYWDDAEEFRPERFLKSNVDFKGHDFQLVPFGAGRRGCPGIAFATVTNEFVLANLVHRFNWELPNGTKGEDLDMGESPGTAIKRKIPLLVVATTPFSC